MSTSTCTPTGGGASQCVYSYRKEISTTTETTDAVETTQRMASTTELYYNVATITMFIVIGFMFTVATTLLVKKLT